MQRRVVEKRGDNLVKGGNVLQLSVHNIMDRVWIVALKGKAFKAAANDEDWRCGFCLDNVDGGGEIQHWRAVSASLTKSKRAKLERSATFVMEFRTQKLTVRDLRLNANSCHPSCYQE